MDYANSEIGTIQDVEKLTDLIHFYNGKIYVDCTGSISQIPLDVKKLDIDIAGFSAHKLGSLKGCGVLYKRIIFNYLLLYMAHKNMGFWWDREYTWYLNSRIRCKAL